MGLSDSFRLKALVGGVGRNVAKFGLAVLALFFLYRHGASVLGQFRRVAARWLGEASRGYIQAVGVTVRAVLFGIVLTALAQGVLAGLGYWVAGVPAPALWGVITALVSHFVVYFRSWDLWAGFPANLAGIQQLKEYMAAQIEVEGGEIIAVSKGMHLYDYTWDLAKLRTYRT